MSVDADSGREEKMVWDDENLEDESEFIVHVEVCAPWRVSDRGVPKVGFRWEYGVPVAREDISAMFSYKQDGV